MPQISSAGWWRPEPVLDVPAVERAPARSASGRLAFAALSLFIVVLVLTPQDFIAALVPLRLARLAALSALAAHLLHRMSRGRPAGPVPRPLLLIGLLVAWAVFTVPFSLWPNGSVEVLTEPFLKAVLVCWLLAGVLTTVARLRAMVWLLCLTTVPLALTALANYARGDLDRIAGYGRGLAGNPNDLALFLALMVPLSGALAAITRGPRRAVALAVIVFAVAGTVATYSRGGFITLAVAVVLGLIVCLRRHVVATAVASLLVAASVVALTPGTYLNRLSTITDINADPTGSSQERWRDMRVAAAYVVEHPVIGAGIGMDILALNALRGPTWRTVHNSYLNYGVDLGLPGLGLFVLLIGSALATAWRVERRRPTTEEFAGLPALAGGIRIALLAFAVGALFYPVAYHFFFYMLAGLAVAAGRLSQRSESPQLGAGA